MSQTEPMGAGLRPPTLETTSALAASLDAGTIASWATRGALPPIGGSLSPGSSVGFDRVWLDRMHVPIGYATLYNYAARSRSAYVGALVVSSRRGGSTFYLMCAAFLSDAFTQLSLDRVFCEIPESNVQMLKSIEHFGFERVALLSGRDYQDGQPEDVHIYHGESAAVQAAILRRNRRA